MASSAAHWWTLRARIAVAIFALSAVPITVLLVRCGGSPVAGAPDAGAPDAAPDRVRRPDAGADTGDDGACSVTSDWPGFRRLTEFDPCAPADVLVDPDAGYDMAWTDCGDAGIAGCRQLRQLVPQQFTYAYATYDNAGAGEALYLDQGLSQLSTVRQFDIIDLKTSVRLGEWRIDADKANGAEVVLANATDTTTAFLGWRSSALFAALAPAPVLFAANPMTLTPYPAPGQDINLAVSEQVMAFQPMGAPYTICLVATGKCVPLDMKGMAPAVPYYEFAWHDVVFAAAFHGTTGWGQEYVVHADGSIALLRANPNAHIWGMVTDGTTLVWNETYGTTDLNGAQTTSEIWKAPFTSDRATLTTTATKVGTLPVAGLGPAIYFNGIYATYYGGWSSIYAMQVSSGKSQTVAYPIAGASPSGLVYVDANEIWATLVSPTQDFALVRAPISTTWN